MMDITQKTLTKQNIKHDSYDSSKFSKMFYKSELKDNLVGHAADYPYYPEMTKDIFNSLFKYVPEMEDENFIQTDYKINRRFIKEAMNSPSWKQLRAYTKLDEAGSAIAAATLSESILEQNKGLFEQIKNHQKKINEYKRILAKQHQELKNLQALGEHQQAQSLKKQMKQQIRQTKQQLKKQMQVANQVSCNSAMQTANDVMNAQNQMFSGRGLGSGSFQKVSIEERLKFSKIYVSNKKFKKLIEILGRMKRLAERKQREKTKHAVETIENITMGNNLQHLIPSELLNLLDPQAERLFDKRYIENELLIYEHSGKKKTKKGPIISCLDVSGSMSGDRDATAKAVALALCMIALKQKRNSVVILFDGRVRKIFEFDMKSRKDHWNRLLKLAEFFTGGGTSFNDPLKKATEYFEKHEDYKRADLVWITDGDGHLDEKLKVQFLDLKKEKGINCYSIIIDESFNFVEHALQDISDKLVAVNELTDKEAGDLFESI
ncbi:MAG: VWA domain-containing protein [Candidatus Lokiarchaeota archaeon]|nr:VWA domain-containing protein [Candidatus Lokiarchaeota archaeon]MBD3353981.1 VWA domain-containing protein [Candidatus Lokiarchaeota archaeon]